jgi:hypothetical protein
VALVIRCLERHDVPPLPFADGAFDLAFSSNVYSHLDTAAARAEFVAEALRVACALVVLEQSDGWSDGGFAACRNTDRRQFL